MPCRVTQDGRVMVESSDKMWSTGEGNGKPLQYSCLENPMNSMNRTVSVIWASPKIKSVTVLIVSPSIFHEVKGLAALVLAF